MSTTLLKPRRPATSIDQVVAERLLAHLAEEQGSLEAMLTAVRNVHQALRSLNDEALRASIEAEARELALNVQIQERRRQLRSELAEVLQIEPAQVTLRRLVELTSGSVRESVEGLWQSLSKMAAELEVLNRQNAAMIGQSLTIARGVVERLTGVNSIGDSYNALGTREETHVGPLVQWGG